MSSGTSVVLSDRETGRPLSAAVPARIGNGVVDAMREKTESEGGGHYVFGMDEVLSRNVQQFLDRYDPGGLSSVELRGLFGRLSIEVEAAAECGDLATIPEARQLLRRLHERWPWAGFFLDLRDHSALPRLWGNYPSSLMRFAWWI